MDKIARRQKQQEDERKGFFVLERKHIDLRKVGDKAAVAVPEYLLFENEHDRRQDEHNGDYAEQNALCHDKADIKAEL